LSFFSDYKRSLKYAAVLYIAQSRIDIRLERETGS